LRQVLKTRPSGDAELPQGGLANEDWVAVERRHVRVPGDRAIRLKLHAVTPDVTYVLTDFDAAGAMETTGRELLEKGLSIVAKDRPGAVIVTYGKKP